MAKNTIVDILRRKVNKTIYQQQLIEDGDKVVLGLSGGKDSLALLDILSFLRPSMRNKFILKAIHIHISNVGYKIDTEFLQQFCKDRDVELEIISFEADLSAKEKSICAPCSWNRRRALFANVIDTDYTKLALGHHMDDYIETLLMNMMFHGIISSTPYKLQMFKGKINLIRPLMDIKRSQLKEYALAMNFPKELKTCPYGENTKRISMIDVVDKMELLNKEARINLFRSTQNIYPQYIPNFKLINDDKHFPDIEIM